MNDWLGNSIIYAMDKNYLDMLYSIYPLINNEERIIHDNLKQNIIKNFNDKNNQQLIQNLLKLELFPIKDSYVAFLRKYKKAIKQNPKTIDRLCSIIYNMPLDTLIAKCQEPKETNRQIGPMFKNWVKNSNTFINIKKSNMDIDILHSDSTILHIGNDNDLYNFAKNHLGYTRDKGIDFIVKVVNKNTKNHKYIVGEAKFLTDFGGHQNAQLEDALATAKSGFNDGVIPIVILDGVCYIKNNSKMYKRITSEPDLNIMSALFLYSFILYQEGL